jgi:hypothetical protein
MAPARSPIPCLAPGLLDSSCVRDLAYSALIAVAALTGCASSSSTSSANNPFGDAITHQQYASLKLGQDEQTLVDQLQESGKPENLVADRFVKLFPRHDPSAVSCSYWQIAGDSTLLVRLCFSSPAGKLVQKLERRASG